MKPKQSSLLIVVAGALVLLGAVGMVVIGGMKPSERKFKGSLADFLPGDIPAWTIEHRPVAETPEIQKAVAEQLNYDDAVYAIYKKGTAQVSFYIAYWTPGKMPVRLIASHTPDTCWVYNGWRKIAGSEMAGLTVSGFNLPPVEARTMMFGSHHEYVLFWHMVDGAAKSYSNQGLPPWHAMFTDSFERGLNQRNEQFFIRVSSNLEISELLKSDPFVEFVQKGKAVFQ